MTKALSRVTLVVVPALAAISLSACGVASFQLSSLSSQHDTNTQMIDMPAGAAVIVTNDIGGTDIAVDSNATQATVEVRRESVADSQDAADALLESISVAITPPTAGNNVLTISAPKPAGATTEIEALANAEATDDASALTFVEARIKITLPPGHAVQATQGPKSGSLTALGLDTSSVLVSSTTFIASSGATAAISATTMTGGIEIDDHAGPVTATSDTGSIDIEIIALGAADTVQAKSIGGDIDLELPANVDATLSALTLGGAVEFKAHRFTGTSNVAQSASSLSATLNNGGATIAVQTEGGDISIRASHD